MGRRQFTLLEVTLTTVVYLGVGGWTTFNYKGTDSGSRHAKRVLHETKLPEIQHILYQNGQ